MGVYPPLDTLKPVDDDIWVIDGAAVSVRGLPFPTRATVVRLAGGDLWVHSPTRLADGLCAELAATGPVRHLVVSNRHHWTWLGDWQAAFPDAVSWAAPGVVEQAAKGGLALRIDHPLRPDRAETPWAGQIEQMIPRGSRLHREAVFFHRASHTLILTDLIVALETRLMPVWTRPLVWLAGLDDRGGGMPPGTALSFRDRRALAEDVERMIGWEPRRVIPAHGRWYREQGAAELERAFRKLLRAYRWERAGEEMRRMAQDRDKAAR